MSRCYAILFADDDSGVGYARDQSEILHLPYTGTVDDWAPLLVDLHEGGYADYQGSDLGWRLCSERLRQIFDDAAGNSDVFQWLPVTVIWGSAERPHYVLHFPEPPDLLDVTETLYGPDDLVIRPAFRRSALEGHNVFCYPNNEGLRLYVS